MASSGGVRIIESDSRFRSELTGAKGTLIIANFKASWCGPSQIIAPKFEELSLEYTSAIFVEVDVDACEEICNQYSVSGTPTFILFRSGIKLDQLQGSDAKTLEDEIKKWMGDYEEIGGTVPKGYDLLANYISNMASSGGARVRIIDSDSRFRSELTGAEGKLIIANFKASWCGPSQMIAPKFEELSLKYTSAIFLEVDVDACEEICNQYSVSDTPTFIFFQSGIKLDELQGSDAKTLEDEIKKWMGDYEEIGGTVPKGYVSLDLLANYISNMASSGGARVRIIESDSRFRSELTGAKGKLIIANFKASWCGPSLMIGPKFQELGLKYTSALFLELDVDACEEICKQYSVSAIPTFIFFRSGIKLDQLQGSDDKTLEDKIKKWMGDYEEIGGTVPKGYMDLSSLIDKSQCECLNESDDHTLKNVFQKGKSLYLESDCDEQMLISISFNQSVKLHSLRLYAPDDGTAPKTVKIFSNLTRTFGFDEAEETTAVQELSLTAENVAEDILIPLKFVKFQYVQSVTLFIKDNQGDEKTTIINSLSFIGTTVESTNMSDFKRVAGTEGEAHG